VPLVTILPGSKPEKCRYSLLLYPLPRLSASIHWRSPVVARSHPEDEGFEQVFLDLKDADVFTKQLYGIFARSLLQGEWTTGTKERFLGAAKRDK
jgi:hypothetical protein